jgi:hypothetical protein
MRTPKWFDPPALLPISRVTQNTLWIARQIISGRPYGWPLLYRSETVC